MRFYRDLAQWYPLITTAADYADEADHIARLVAAGCHGEATTLLELGCGAGHMASHLTSRFRCTLSDLSPQMLGLSRDLNRDCEHIEGDMRALDLQRRFDVVLAHDAIGYMITVDDLRAAITTASSHLRPGGLAIFLPDIVSDTFAPSTSTGGHDAPDGRALRYLEWTHDPDPSDTEVQVDYALMLRQPGRPVRVEQDTHRIGLFQIATWRRLMAEAGLDPLDLDVPDPYAGQHAVFVGRKMTSGH